MTRALQNDGWLGYAALVCVAIFALAPRIGIGSELILGLLYISVMVFGVYCSVRGVIRGSIPSRICAGSALIFWSYVAYMLYAVVNPS
jgi:O-antigen/teichoic acid export membrane protein